MHPLPTPTSDDDCCEVGGNLGGEVEAIGSGISSDDANIALTVDVPAIADIAPGSVSVSPGDKEPFTLTGKSVGEAKVMAKGGSNTYAEKDFTVFDVEIISVSPSPYTPACGGNGQDLVVEYEITPSGFAGESGQLTVTDTHGNVVYTDTGIPLTGGTHTVTWSGASASLKAVKFINAPYEIKIEVTKAHAICDGKEYEAGTLGLPTIGFDFKDGGTGVKFNHDGRGNGTLVVQGDFICGDIKVKAFMKQANNTDFMAAGAADLETVEIIIKVRKVDALQLNADKTMASLGDTVTFNAIGTCKDAYVGEDPDPRPKPGDFLQGVTYDIVAGANLGSLAQNILMITSPLGGTIQVRATWTCPNNPAVPVVQSKVVDITVNMTAEVDLDIDSDNDNRNAAPERDNAEDGVEETVPGKIILVNVDDDDSDGTLDYSDQTVNGNSDRDHDMAVMVAQVAVVHVDLHYHLAASDYSPVRVFTHDGDYLIGPDPGHNSEQELTSDMFTGTQLTMHVEGVETGDTTISLIVRDNGNVLGSDAVLITVTDSLETPPLTVPHIQQHKDTQMLCVAGCPVLGPGDHEWDKDHGAYSRACDHCQQYCARATIAMMSRYYGGTPSQDRISYYVYAGQPNPNGGDLGHNRSCYPVQSQTQDPSPLPWALGLDVSGAGRNDLDVLEHPFRVGNLADWQAIANAVLSYRPLYMSWRPGGFGHASCVAGVRITAAGDREIRVFNPARRAAMWLDFGTVSMRWLYAPAEDKVASINAWHDEASVSAHSDDDGVVDFDEDNRFSADLGYALDKTNPDSNGVPPDDKEEIRVRYGVR